MTSYVEKLLTHLSVSVPPGCANSGGGAQSGPSENNKIEESEILTHLQGSPDITDIRVKNGFQASRNAGMDDTQKATEAPNSQNHALTQVEFGVLPPPQGPPAGAPCEAPREAPYAPPACMECGYVGGVAYVELEGGDLLCGSCYAATLRELAAIEKASEKRLEERK